MHRILLSMLTVVLVGALSIFSGAKQGSATTLADFEAGLPGGLFSFVVPSGSISPRIIDVSSSTAYFNPQNPTSTQAMLVSHSLSTMDLVGGFGSTLSGSDRDWSGDDGLSFWWLGAGTGLEYHFILEDNGGERFIRSFVDSAGWNKVTLGFDTFARWAGFQPSGAPNDGLTLTDVNSWAINVPIGVNNTIVMDDLLLYRDETPAVPLPAGLPLLLAGLGGLGLLRRTSAAR